MPSARGPLAGRRRGPSGPTARYTLRRHTELLAVDRRGAQTRRARTRWHDAAWSQQRANVRLCRRGVRPPPHDSAGVGCGVSRLSATPRGRGRPIAAAPLDARGARRDRTRTARAASARPNRRRRGLLASARERAARLDVSGASRVSHPARIGELPAPTGTICAARLRISAAVSSARYAATPALRPRPPSRRARAPMPPVGRKLLATRTRPTPLSTRARVRTSFSLAAPHVLHVEPRRARRPSRASTEGAARALVGNGSRGAPARTTGPPQIRSAPASADPDTTGRRNNAALVSQIA